MSQTAQLIERLCKRGLTQVEIARMTDIPQPRLSKWRAGAVPVGADDALKLQALVKKVEAKGKAKRTKG